MIYYNQPNSIDWELWLLAVLISFSTKVSLTFLNVLTWYKIISSCCS